MVVSDTGAVLLELILEKESRKTAPLESRTLESSQELLKMESRGDGGGTMGRGVEEGTLRTAPRRPPPL